MMKKTVVELFAGVGGFRVGLNKVHNLQNDKAVENGSFEIVWMSQWEPSTKSQDAFFCYEKRFGESTAHSNMDISLVDKSTIPNHTLLVGGFPCQDYSVARSLSNEKGIEGKKGVLWWQIAEILEKKKPPFVLLENVDRLLKSPSKQRGRDFGIMLRTFHEYGYDVEWRVINAAEYGHVQRRRRVYIFAYKHETQYSKGLSSLSIDEVIRHRGLFAMQFPVTQMKSNYNVVDISKKKFSDLIEVSKTFVFDFENGGYLRNNEIITVRLESLKTPPKSLSTIVETRDVEPHYFITNKYEKFFKLKDKKKIERLKNGVKYIYSEGAISFPDELDMPGRTMLTSEGTLNRSTHIIKDVNSGNLRILTPVEAERMNEFPDNWTDTGMIPRKRYFMMGNALVCGIIEKIGARLESIIDNE